MKAVLFAVAGATALLSGCATPSQTAWGKANVSKVDYGTDIGMCTGLAAQVGGGNQTKTAGGTSGASTSAQPPAKPQTGAPAETSGAGSPAQSPYGPGANLPTGSGMYADNMSQDMVQRAANQQQSQVMAQKRARAETLKSCLVDRGYAEFALTPEQQTHLNSLKPGSNEQLEYLFKLGADPAVLRSQGTAK